MNADISPLHLLSLFHPWMDGEVARTLLHSKNHFSLSESFHFESEHHSQKRGQKHHPFHKRLT
jgi:hypothetical protein